MATTMTCVYASGVFVQGESYKAERVDGKLYVYCSIGVAHQIRQNERGQYEFTSDNFIAFFER